MCNSNQHNAMTVDDVASYDNTTLTTKTFSEANKCVGVMTTYYITYICYKNKYVQSSDAAEQSKDVYKQRGG